MGKSAVPERRSRRRRSTRAAGRKADIGEILAGIEGIEVTTPRAAKVISLLKSWLKDDSGYDERTWPKLKAAIDEQRRRVGSAKLFDE